MSINTEERQKKALEISENGEYLVQLRVKISSATSAQDLAVVALVKPKPKIRSNFILKSFARH